MVGCVMGVWLVGRLCDSKQPCEHVVGTCGCLPVFLLVKFLDWKQSVGKVGILRLRPVRSRELNTHTV